MVDVRNLSTELAGAVIDYYMTRGYDKHSVVDACGLDCGCYLDGTQPMFAAKLRGDVDIELVGMLDSIAINYVNSCFMQEYDEESRDMAYVLRSVIDWDDMVDSMELASL